MAVEDAYGVPADAIYAIERLYRLSSQIKRSNTKIGRRLTVLPVYILTSTACFQVSFHYILEGLDESGVLLCNS